MGSSSLLEMSQVLWSRLISGGYHKIGKIDPLHVPVVKVDQSEGNTSYRAIFRNLEVSGLNASTVESVHIVRGRLKSNLSDSEAGYVSYNEQRDLDSIRYRFHTLVKEPKSKSEDKDEEANDRLEKVVEYDPVDMRVREEDDLFQPNSQSPELQRYAKPVEQRQHELNRKYEPIYGDMRVAMNATSRNPASLHLVYSHNYKNADPNPQPKDENYRPCIGACRHYQDHSGRVEYERHPSQQAQLSSNGNAREQTRIYPDQSYNADRVKTESTTADYAMKAQFEGSGFSAEASNGQRPNQFLFKKGNFGISYSDGSQNARVPLESQSGDPVTQMYRVGYAPIEEGNQRPVYFRGFTNQPTPDDTKYSKQERDQVIYQSAAKNKFAESITPSNTEEFEAYKAPMIRLEKQPGYVDIVYASERKPENKPKFENLKEPPADDTRAYGLAEIVKDLRENQRYIIHNFTEGESLKKRNDAVRVASESKRIKDLIRYAKEYQEKEGYFEEGVELIYHFGDLNNSGVSNDSLTRRKRQQHSNDKNEDDVMHVVVRIHVPTLSVKSDYALMGKVGKQLLRGNGLLTGNFTNLIADFTVELKRVNNSTMIVRAARAKLISKDRKIKLQGMDEKGPVEVILTQGLMAAEAVAAMVVDDLASKALNEGNADAMIYKMYKNLPVVERV